MKPSITISIAVILAIFTITVISGDKISFPYKTNNAEWKGEIKELGIKESFDMDFLGVCTAEKGNNLAVIVINTIGKPFSPELIGVVDNKGKSIKEGKLACGKRTYSLPRVYTIQQYIKNDAGDKANVIIRSYYFASYNKKNVAAYLTFPGIKEKFPIN